MPLVIPKLTFETNVFPSQPIWTSLAESNTSPIAIGAMDQKLHASCNSQVDVRDQRLSFAPNLSFIGGGFGKISVEPRTKSCMPLSFAADLNFIGGKQYVSNRHSGRGSKASCLL
jgi:hypothetical protein